jgi:antitoxin component HigA of HigAB toxin-antitoxin module
METSLKEKLAKFATQGSESFLDRLNEQIENRHWLEKSSLFAVAVRQHLIDHKLTQKELAGKLKSSPQAVSKILSGKENLSLSTISEVEQALGSKFSAFGIQYTDSEWYNKHIESSEEIEDFPEKK